ncbi:MAG: MotA/TolQ/ExbB proton channel family protein [Desulfobacteraceae bacterium]|jgi:biopolymer transport protein ExbB
MLNAQISIYAMYAARSILVLLFLLSFFSIAFFIERMIFFKKRFVKDFDSVTEKIDNANSIGDLSAVLSAYRSAETDILLRAIDGRPLTSETFAQRVNGIFLPEKEKWARYSTFLGSVGSNAPFIGLLGTVFGVLKAFADLSLSTTGGPQIVMAGISEALIATAVGLLVAIPAVVFFNLCKVRVKKSVTHLHSLVELISARGFFKNT